MRYNKFNNNNNNNKNMKIVISLSFSFQKNHHHRHSYKGTLQISLSDSLKNIKNWKKLLDSFQFCSSLTSLIESIIIINNNNNNKRMADIINFTSTFYLSDFTRQHLMNVSRNFALASYAAANVESSSPSSSPVQLPAASYMATANDIGLSMDNIVSQTNNVMDNNNNNPFETLQKVVSIIVPILFAVIVIVGLVGNSLVVIVVKCNPQMYSTTNLLIINLAIADLLFIIFCVPFTAWDYAFPYWPFGSVWCKVVQYLIVVCAYASIYTVCINLTIPFFQSIKLFDFFSFSFIVRENFKEINLLQQA